MLFPFATLASASVVPVSAAGGAAFGQFDQHTDIGAVHIPGNATYDADKQTYLVQASGTNMWGDHDEFHFVWKRLEGDFIVQTMVELLGKGADPHRKVGIMVRSSLDPRSPHVNACVHGDGLASLQFRRTEGAPTEEVRFEQTGPNVLELSRRGDTFTMSVAKAGALYASKPFNEVVLGDEVYVGLYVCAHNNEVSEQALHRNVRLVRPANADFVPYRDYIGSDLELLDVASGRRTIISHVDDSFQAPNWTPNGRSLIYNRNGRIYSFDLKKREATLIDTGEQIRNNNDHALSFDGRKLGISSGSPSIVYTLPIKGGAPKQITPVGPSYLHGWSPDGKYLVFTGSRGGDYDIYRVPSDGGPEVRLTDSPGLDDGSEYTPDGKFIYFNSVRTGRMQIWRMKPDGSEQTQITFDDFNNWFPHVAPDGKSIVFVTYGPEIPAGEHPWYKHVYIRRLLLDGKSQPTVLAYVYGGQGSMNVNSWSPNSKTIAFVSNSGAL